MTSIVESVLNQALKHVQIQTADLQANRDLIWNIGEENFAFDRRTVQLNLGRQAGHTTAIAKLALSCDQVYLKFQTMVPLIKNMGCKANCRRYDTDFDYFRGISEHTRIVWIDNASYIPKDEINNIYRGTLKMNVDYVPIFVLLG